MKDSKVKKSYAKPGVSKVKLAVEGPVLGSCWTDDTLTASLANCNTLDVCFV
jgi:hypothetical protein